MILYHVSSLQWGGETKITLLPGPQGAEGAGVYFSESKPRLSAAEGCRLTGIGTIFCVEVTTAAGWWRTKAGIARKHKRPRTWHTQGAPVTLFNLIKIGQVENIPIVRGCYRRLGRKKAQAL